MLGFGLFGRPSPVRDRSAAVKVSGHSVRYNVIVSGTDPPHERKLMQRGPRQAWNFNSGRNTKQEGRLGYPDVCQGVTLHINCFHGLFSKERRTIPLLPAVFCALSKGKKGRPQLLCASPFLKTPWRGDDSGIMLICIRSRIAPRMAFSLTL